MVQQVAGTGMNLEVVYEALYRHRRFAKTVAMQFAGCDWHKLNQRERDIVKMLEESKYLTPATNGFVGRVIDL